jgi:hypothetical protein
MNAPSGSVPTSAPSPSAHWPCCRGLLDSAQRECAERGYLLIPVALMTIDAGDAATAQATFEEAARIGARFGDLDLLALSGLGRGQALIARGVVARSMSLLDEVMVAITAEELAPSSSASSTAVSSRPVNRRSTCAGRRSGRLC